MKQIVTGVVRGNTIILDSPLQVADGHPVEIIVRTVAAPQPWGEGIRKSAGGWAGYPEMDAIMEKIHAQRALERRSVPSS